MKRTILLSLAVATGITAKAQDLHFSIPDASPVYYNPATIGLFKGDKLRLTSNFRRQWNSISDPLQTIAFTADAHFFGLKEKAPFWGFAVGVYSDNAASGGFKSTHFDLGTSYNVWLTKHSILSAGILAGAGIRAFSASSYSWDNQFNGAIFDPGIPSGELLTQESAFYPDLAAGLHYRYLDREEKFRLHAGVGMFHINKPFIAMSTGDDFLYRRLVLHSTSEISLRQNNKIYVVPSVFYQVHGGHSNLVLGSGIKLHFKPQSEITDRKGESSLFFGTYMRFKDAVAVTARVQHKGLGLGVAYDLNVSSLRPATNGKGGPEISLSFIPTFSKLAKVYHQGWLL